MTARVRWVFAVALAMIWLGVGAAVAETPARASATGPAAALSGLAHYLPEGSSLTDAGAGQGGGMNLTLALSQPVPYRISTMANPPRLLLDFREVDWGAFDGASLSRTRHVKALRAGLLQPGWSRLVLELDGPYAVAQAEMQVRGQKGRALVRLELRPVSAESFARTAGQPDQSLWALPKPDLLPVPKRRQTGAAPLIVVLDPGHGGIDPGSINGKVEEKEITLQFARELRELLIRNGIQVVLTRTDDVFVPLETRISVARAAGADLFLSIHADAEASREAVGATVYTLDTDSTDKAAAELAARHDRDDLLAGVDLSNADDQIATILMDMARTETAPRSNHLAGALVSAIKDADIRMHRRPHQQAAFSVLKSPDVPSALLELGYLSSESDLKNLQDPEWRARMAEAILSGIETWAKADAAQAALVRQ